MANAQSPDYIGMWYRARARHGISDAMNFGIINPDAGDIEWHALPHSRHDGIGAVAHLLRRRGMVLNNLPELNEKAPPAWWQIFMAMFSGTGDKPAPPQWRSADQPDKQNSPSAVSWASRVETDMVRRNARELGISVTVLLFWALHQVVTTRLLRETPCGSWMFPVNMRGPVRLESDEMNHSSGFYLPVDVDWTPMELRAEIGRALRERRHWVMWRQARIGRLIGQAGVNRLYDMLASDNRHLGSFSTLGEWNLDLSEAGWHRNALLCCCAPGSPSYPISNGCTIWNGRLTLVLQCHASLGFSQTTIEQCMHDWRALLLDPGAMEVAA
jgi:hypothetical protein